MTDGDWFYVDKADYPPAKNQIDSLIRQAQAILRPEGLTFQVHAIGSGRRKMITCQEGSNKGFDFDYNLELEYVPKDSDRLCVTTLFSVRPPERWLDVRLI